MPKYVPTKRRKKYTSATRNKHPLLAQRCKRCERELIATHFDYGRKSCKTCLKGEPYPAEDATLTVRRPRAVRRKWPEHVVAHDPAPEYDGPCPQCGEKFDRVRSNHHFCSRECRVAFGNDKARKRKWDAMYPERMARKALKARYRKEAADEAEEA